MKKKIFAFTTALMMLLPQYALHAAAITEDTLIERFSQRDSAQTYTAIRPAEDGYVNYYHFDVYDGLVVLCNDAALIESQTVTITYGETAETQRTRTLALRTLAAYEDSYDTYEYGEVDPPVVMPASLEAMADSLYVLSGISTTDAAELIPQIMADERFEVLGLLSVQYQRKAYYNSEMYGTWLHLEAESGYAIDAAALNTEEYHFVTAITFDQGVGYCTAESLSLEEASALCETLEAREEIAVAWLEGTVTGELPPTDITRMVIEPLTETAVSGDVNEDGSVDSADAILALEEYTMVSILEQPSALNDTQQRAADMDEDGIITTADAIAILTLYAESLT